MLLHVVSLEQEDPLAAYYTIRKELDQYDTSLCDKEEWIILTKNDLVEQSFSDQIKNELAKTKNRVLVTDAQDEETYKTLRDALVSHLGETYNS
jgi:GTPase involved in cell partitioning and DNA repair